MSAKKPRTKAATKKSQAEEPFIFGLVRDAAPVARELLHKGLDTTETEPLFTYFHEFIEGENPPVLTGIEENDFGRVMEIADGAYAIGIAVGLLLRPEAFLKGGAK